MPKKFLAQCKWKTIWAAWARTGFSLACALCTHAAAADSSLEAGELTLFADIPSVFGASKYEQSLKEAPASVSIITSDEIRKYGYRNLAEVLRSVRGFYTTNDRAYTYLGTRGFNRLGDYNTRVLLLVDGIRLNDNIFEQAFIGNETLIDVDMIERVEIIRGPSSSLYGTNAFFATINLITKRGRDFKGGEVALEVGSLKTYKGRISYGNRFENGLEAMVSISSYLSDGHPQLYYPEFDDPATHDGIAQDVDNERYHNFLAKLAHGDFSLQAGMIKREKTLPTAAYADSGVVFNSPHTRIVDPTFQLINAKYEHDLDNDATLLLRVGYGAYLYRGDYDYGTFIDYEKDDGRWWSGEATLTRRIGERHRIVVGAEEQYNTKQRQQSIGETGTSLDSNSTFNRWAIYIQDEIRWNEQLILNLGVRHDRYENFGATTNPRVALIHPRGINTFKLLYGTSFRAPSVFEMYYTDGVSQKINPNLKPETIKTYELVWERSLRPNLRGLATGFHYEIDRLITFGSDPNDQLYVFTNENSAAANGLELELEGHFSSQLEGRLSYAYQRNRDSQATQYPQNSPRQLAKVNLITPLIKGRVFAGMEIQYTSRLLTKNGSYEKSNVMTNVTFFSRHLLPHLEVSANIYNVFDRAYADPAADIYIQNVIPQDGRTYRIKAKYEF